PAPVPASQRTSDHRPDVALAEDRALGAPRPLPRSGRLERNENVVKVEQDRFGRAQRDHGAPRLRPAALLQLEKVLGRDLLALLETGEEVLLARGLRGGPVRRHATSAGSV